MIIFWCVSLEFFSFMAAFHAMWDLSFSTGNQTWEALHWKADLNHWPPGKSLNTHLKREMLLTQLPMMQLKLRQEVTMETGLQGVGRVFIPGELGIPGERMVTEKHWKSKGLGENRETSQVQGSGNSDLNGQKHIWGLYLWWRLTQESVLSMNCLLIHEIPVDIGVMWLFWEAMPLEFMKISDLYFLIFPCGSLFFCFCF